MLESGVDLFVAVGGTEEERDGVSGEWELLSMQFRMDQTKKINKYIMNLILL